MLNHFIVVIKAIIIRVDPKAPDSINHQVFNQVLVTYKMDYQLAHNDYLDLLLLALMV